MTLSGSPIDFVLAFAGGVFASLSPCVYPLIPVTAGFIGVNSAGNKAKGLFLSFIYVSGIAVTYSVLGLLASLTGKIFGQVSSHPLTHIIVGILIILFGLAMLDIIKIGLPLLKRRQEYKKHSYLSAFILGLSSGLVIGPCLTPVLGSILAYLVTRKNILYGMSLLVTFAYGMGLLLIIIGASSSALLGLPKAGKWMLYIQRISALVLLGMGLYFMATGIRSLL